MSGNFSGKFGFVDHSVVIGIDSIESLVEILFVAKFGTCFFTVDDSISVPIDILKNRRTVMMVVAVVTAVAMVTIIVVVMVAVWLSVTFAVRLAAIL